MKYTTDTTPIVEKFLADQHATAQQTVANLHIDRQTIEFCAALREYGGEDPDPALAEGLEVNATQLVDAQAREARLAEKLADVPRPDAAARAAWLIDYVAQLEAEHVRHALLAEDAVDPDQAEAHQIAMITIDAAHGTALAELDQLEPKPA